MINRIFNIADHIFDYLNKQFESHFTTKIISSALVLIFVVSIIISFLVNKEVISLGTFDTYFKNPFFAIEIVFTLLLIVELLSLIFVLPESVAKSVGKQFELLSLIFIRAGFKEFGHLHNIHLTHLPDEIYHIFAYALAALAIFVIMGFIYKLQKHSKLKVNETDQKKFVQAKKSLSILLLLAFFIIGISDIVHLMGTGQYIHSFDKFYTVLIFSDIIIVLIALRYTLNYYRIFRYSAFVLATILIRLALTSEIYNNVILGVSAAVYVLLLTIFYNYFLSFENRDLIK